MSSVYKSPMKLLDELGIMEPSDIDIEAIAQYCGATIVYERLEGCAARILGNGDEAIITIDDRAPIKRRRFSAGHELGHWMRDREKIRFSCTEMIMQREWDQHNPERGANEYAADLLLPRSMFIPLARGKPLTLDSAAELGNVFQTSLTSTAIHLLRHGSFPGMLIYSQDGRRKWFMRGEGVQECLWPNEKPTGDTYAADLLTGTADTCGPAPIQAAGWIAHPRSQWYEVIEHSVRVSQNSILTMLWWKNEKQLIDLNAEEGDYER